MGPGIGPSLDPGEAVEKPAEKHEETAEFWRAMHAEEKRKKQSVSAKLSDAIRENDRLRDARDAVVGLMNGYLNLGPCCERDDARDLINDALACFDNYEEGTP